LILGKRQKDGPEKSSPKFNPPSKRQDLGVGKICPPVIGILPVQTLEMRDSGK
jgi:hypothetical protein